MLKRPTPAKVMKAMATTGKRAEEKVQLVGATPQRKQAVSGSAPDVFASEKFALIHALGAEQKQFGKHPMALKQQVQLEALRREQSSQAAEAKRALSLAAIQPQNALSMQ